MATVMALPAIPATAQPEVQSGPIAATPADCTIRLSVANPSPGDQEVPRSLVLSGNAIDATATSGSGISQVEAFLGNRDFGGTLVGIGSLGSTGNWSLTTEMPPNISGGQSLFVYSQSSISGQEAFVSIPVVIGESLSGMPVSENAVAFCPSLMPTPAPTTAPIIATAEPTAVPTLVPSQPVVPTATPVPVEPINPPLPVTPPAALQLSVDSPASPPLTFSPAMLSATAGAQVTVTYTNDSALPHSWHVFQGPDSNSPSLAATRIIGGPGQTDTVTFAAPSQPGTYFVWCDVHTTAMTGSFVVSNGQ
jgi:plastocyanin